MDDEQRPTGPAWPSGEQVGGPVGGALGGAGTASPPTGPVGPPATPASSARPDRRSGSPSAHRPRAAHTPVVPVVVPREPPFAWSGAGGRAPTVPPTPPRDQSPPRPAVPRRPGPAGAGGPPPSASRSWAALVGRGTVAGAGVVAAADGRPRGRGTTTAVAHAGQLRGTPVDIHAVIERVTPGVVQIRTEALDASDTRRPFPVSGAGGRGS